MDNLDYYCFWIIFALFSFIIRFKLSKMFIQYIIQFYFLYIFLSELRKKLKI